MSGKTKWTKEQLEQAVKESKGYREVGRRLGLKGGGIFLKKKCLELLIDTSHFVLKPKIGETSYYQYLGKPINYLNILDVIVEYDILHKKNKYYFLCSCLKCGKENVKKRCPSVLRGTTKTCGCKKDMYVSNRGSKSYNWTGCGAISGSWMKKLRRQAKVRGYELNVSIEYLSSLYENQNKKCAYTDIDIVFGIVDDKQSKTASLDRIDNTKGYVVGNVQWVHKKINLLKHTLSHKDFVELCKLVARKYV